MQTNRTIEIHSTDCKCETCSQENANVIILQQRLREIRQAIKEKKTQAAKSENAPIINIAAARDAVVDEIARTRTRHHLWSGISLVCVCLVACAWFKPWPTKKPTHENQQLSTVDGSFLIDTTGSFAHVSGRRIAAATIPIYQWHGDLGDEFALLRGAFDNCIWVKETPTGFETDTHAVVYRSDAPEMKVLEQMKDISQAATTYFRAHGQYPTQASDIAQATSVINPISKVKDQVIFSKYVGATLVSAIGKTKFQMDIEGGKKVGAGQDLHPYQIECIEAQSEPNVASDFNSYGWKTNTFFIRGCDRNGNYIRTGDNKNAFTIALKNGSNQSDTSCASTPTGQAGTASSLCIYSDQKPDKAGLAFRYGLIGFAAMLLVFFQVFMKFHRHVTESVDEEMKEEPNDSDVRLVSDCS